MQAGPWSSHHEHGLLTDGPYYYETSEPSQSRRRGIAPCLLRRPLPPRLISIVSAALRAALTAELIGPAGPLARFVFRKRKRCETAPRADSRVANKSFERKSASLRRAFSAPALRGLRSTPPLASNEENHFLHLQSDSRIRRLTAFTLGAFYVGECSGFRLESEFSSRNIDPNFFFISTIIGFVAFLYGYFSLKFRKCWNKKEEDKTLPNK